MTQENENENYNDNDNWGCTDRQTHTHYTKLAAYAASHAAKCFANALWIFNITNIIEMTFKNDKLKSKFFSALLKGRHSLKKTFAESIILQTGNGT